MFLLPEEEYTVAKGHLEMRRVSSKSNAILIRACPRCHGDLYRDMLEDDEFVCLQCGLRTYRSRLAQATSGNQASERQPVASRAP